jgi:hypothetical protein
MNLWNVPPGKARGLLPRKAGYGTVCRPADEVIDVIPREEWSSHIGKISLRPYVNVIFDQDGIGSCATESTTQAIQVVRAWEGKPFVQLNPLFVYHTTSGGHDRGSNIDDNLRFILKYGVAPEAIWPRDKGFKATPSAEAKDAALDYKGLEWADVGTVLQFGSGLLKGYPIVFGYDGHSVLAVEVIDSESFRYVNSWDKSWGDNGFGVAKFDWINWGYGAWALRSTTGAAV